jgi:hypothetical protein
MKIWSIQQCGANSGWHHAAVVRAASTLEFDMSTIEIRDLAENRELDRKAMVAVRGGMSFMARTQPSDPVRLLPGDPIRSFPTDPFRPVSSNIGLVP